MTILTIVKDYIAYIYILCNEKLKSHHYKTNNLSNKIKKLSMDMREKDILQKYSKWVYKKLYIYIDVYRSI